MATTSPLKEDIISSVLEEMVKTMDQAPFKLPKITSGTDHPGYSLESTDKYHEAGYDAFITGTVSSLVKPFFPTFSSLVTVFFPLELQQK